jgi:two-component system chemotaxis response regulator CheB
VNIIKLLIIDDSSIVHLLLNKIVAEQKDIEIVGEAYNGKEGVDLAMKLSPDVIIMDIGMPEMDGLEAIGEIMNEKPTPIIVFSGASKSTVDISFKAIELGAVHIIEKPLAKDLSELKQFMDNNLLHSIRMFADFKVIRHIKKKTGLHPEGGSHLEQAANRLKDQHLKNQEHFEQLKLHEEDKKPPVHVAKTTNHTTATANFPIIGIAASTGGPQTIKKLIENIAMMNLNAGIVIVQHMAEGFMQGFCDWLAGYSSIPVTTAKKDELIEAGHIYIAPGEYHLEFSENGRFKFIDSPPILGIRPSASIMFASLAETYKKRVIGVVLTGMGEDGTKGLLKVKQNGGYVIAQDEESSLVFGMPKAAFEAGVVDKVLNLSAIADFLKNLCKERVSDS